MTPARLPAKHSIPRAAQRRPTWLFRGREIRRPRQEARRLLKQHRNKLDAIVSQLLIHESLHEPDIYAAAGIPRPSRSQSPTPVAP